VLELHGWGDLQISLNALARQGKWREMGGLIDDGMLGAFAVVAPLDELPAAYARWVGGLADRTGFTPPDGVDADATAELVAAVRTTAAELAVSGSERAGKSA
jgi:hypothetical protein